MPRGAVWVAVSIALLPAGTPPAAAEPLTAQEEKALSRCETIFSPGPSHLDPTQAAVCLKVLGVTGTVSDKMASDKLDPEARKRVNRALKNASALKDLGDVFTLQASSGALKVALAERTFCSGPLNSLGLGPSPKLLADWAARYRPARAPLLDAVMRGWNWDAFPAVLKARLLAEIKGGSGADWDERCLERRYAPLFRAAALAADDIMALPAAALDDEALARMRQAALVLRAYLDEEKGLALDEHLRQVERYLALRKRYAGVRGLPGGAKGQAKLDEYSRRLKSGDLSLSEHMSFLGAIFGEAPGAGETKGSAGRKGGPSLILHEDALAAALVPAMLEEIKGTRSGDRILSFYKDESIPAKDRGLVVEIAPLENNLGLYNGESIVVSRENVEAWMLRHDIPSADDIIKDPKLLRELSRYIAPTFVHEATHQEQRAWLLKQGLANRYYVEREVEAMGVGALFVLEKDEQQSRLGNGTYLQSIHFIEVDRARRLYEDGVTGVRRFVAPAYSQVSSFDAFASEDFELAEAVQEELAKRAQDPKDAEEEVWRRSAFSEFILRWNQGRGRGAEVPDLKTETLLRLMKENFAGYQKLSGRLDEADGWVSGGLQEIKKREEVKR